MVLRISFSVRGGVASFQVRDGLRIVCLHLKVDCTINRGLIINYRSISKGTQGIEIRKC